MVWRRGLDGGTTGGGQPHDGPAGVVGARLPGDEAAVFHPAELVGDSAAVPPDYAAEIPRPEAPAGRLRERDEQGVFRSGEPGIADELTVQRVSQLPLQVAVA